MLAIKNELEVLNPMEVIVKRSPTPPSVGDLVEGAIIAKEKMAVYVDLGHFGTGLIFGREYLNAREVLKKSNVGDVITVKVVLQENDEGYLELSLREARQAAIWTEAEKLLRDKTPVELLIKDANKGGLIVDWQGIVGFLPASQLKPEHYPRVEDGDKDKILRELKNLVGQRLTVSIIAADSKEGKLIFSEKGVQEKDRQALVDKYHVGDVLPGVVTGAVDFGVFVRIEEGLEGLVHISEIDWALVENPRELYRAGDNVTVKVIEVKDNKVSLSIKALKENPWVEAGKKYKKGEVVSGVVIKHNRHGALISIEEGVAGLVHISDFASEELLRRTLELGKTYTFQITLFEAKEQRMTLHFVQNGTTVPAVPSSESATVTV